MEKVKIVLLQLLFLQIDKLFTFQRGHAANNARYDIAKPRSGAEPFTNIGR